MDPNEHKKFANFCDDWWDENGSMRPLQAFNNLRIPIVIDGLKSAGIINTEANDHRPLEGLEILDVGCGAGFLSESLARLGATVIGVDGVEKLITQARQHALLDKNLTKLSYISKPAEELGEEHIKKYDAVIASEVLDHVFDKENFIKMTTRYLKPGGLYMASTISKTRLATTCATDVPENILCFIPKGIHEYHMFITAEETQNLLKKYKNYETFISNRFGAYSQCYIFCYSLSQVPVVRMDSDEVSKFKRMCEMWWDKHGLVKPLHAMNKVRITGIIEGLDSMGIINRKNSVHPLQGFSVLDIGCGCGILTEALAKLGATVTGVDGVKELIEAARHHASNDKTLINLSYVASSIQEYADDNKEKYDFIVASEVLEHVSDKKGFIEASVKCLKPGGSFFLTTISQSVLTETFAILLPEYILNYIIRGIHEYDKCITPEKTEKLLRECNCTTKNIRGMFFDSFANDWFWMKSTSTFYFIHVVKN